jgi:quaternary ammonium compound-resistance protein SugE
MTPAVLVQYRFPYTRSNKQEKGEVIVPWVLLFIASICEVIFAVAMKQAQGFTKLVPSIVVILGAAGGIFFLTMALKSLPLSIGYPIWTGVGIVGTVVLGLIMFNEPLSALKVAGIALVFVGVVMLQQSEFHG